MVRYHTSRLAAAFFAVTTLFISVNAGAQDAPLSAPATVRSVLATPDAEIDFAKAKLTFDKLVSPTLDISATLNQLDLASETVTRMAGPSSSNRAKLTAIRTYIYESGDGMTGGPFSTT